MGNQTTSEIFWNKFTRKRFFVRNFYSMWRLAVLNLTQFEVETHLEMSRICYKLHINEYTEIGPIFENFIKNIFTKIYRK